ncbi:MAG: hypothetical protein ABH859_05990 [Pseudomonadota bacterium]
MLAILATPLHMLLIGLAVGAVGAVVVGGAATAITYYLADDSDEVDELERQNTEARAAHQQLQTVINGARTAIEACEANQNPVVSISDDLASINITCEEQHTTPELTPAPNNLSSYTLVSGECRPQDTILHGLDSAAFQAYAYAWYNADVFPAIRNINIAYDSEFEFCQGADNNVMRYDMVEQSFLNAIPDNQQTEIAELIDQINGDSSTHGPAEFYAINRTMSFLRNYINNEVTQTRFQAEAFRNAIQPATILTTPIREEFGLSEDYALDPDAWDVPNTALAVGVFDALYGQSETNSADLNSLLQTIAPANNIPNNIPERLLTAYDLVRRLTYQPGDGREIPAERRQEVIDAIRQGILYALGNYNSQTSAWAPLSLPEDFPEIVRNQTRRQEYLRDISWGGRDGGPRMPIGYALLVRYERARAALPPPREEAPPPPPRQDRPPRPQPRPISVGNIVTDPQNSTW